MSCNVNHKRPVEYLYLIDFAASTIDDDSDAYKKELNTQINKVLHYLMFNVSVRKYLRIIQGLSYGKQ